MCVWSCITDHTAIPQERSMVGYCAALKIAIINALQIGVDVNLFLFVQFNLNISKAKPLNHVPKTKIHF